MCLVLFRPGGEGVSLVVASNRDEFRARPTAPAGFWSDFPDILAGRDLEQGGTWMGITRQGRIALVTNVRDQVKAPLSPVSRGSLVTGFLRGTMTAQEYAAEVHGNGHQYAGFNLVCGQWNELVFVSNRTDGPVVVKPGVHGLSNGPLDAPWPKVVSGRRALAESDDVETLLAALNHADPAPDADLPDTGVGLEFERMLSPMFIRGTTYGTRASTVLTVTPDGLTTFVERTFDSTGATGIVSYQF